MPYGEPGSVAVEEGEEFGVPLLYAELVGVGHSQSVLKHIDLQCVRLDVGHQN